MIGLIFIPIINENAIRKSGGNQTKLLNRLLKLKEKHGKRTRLDRVKNHRFLKRRTSGNGGKIWCNNK
jgi:acid phosphatase family membrane protein YuiD